MANCAWFAPKPRNAPHTGLLVRAAIESTSIAGTSVRTTGVSCRPLEHLHPDRGVRAGVADHARPQRGEPSVVVATGPILHPDRVPLRVDQQRLLARERALHRPPEQPRRQRGLGLVGHVLLAAERAAVRDELDGHASRVDAEHRRDLVAVVPDALAARPHVQPIGPVRQDDRSDEGRLRLEERVLDALGLEHLVHDVRARRQRGVDIAARVGRARQHVAFETPHRVVRAGRDGLTRIDDRRQRPIVDFDELCRGPGGLAVLRNDDREDVTQVGRAPAFGDEDRPVLVDQPDAELTRYVGGGEDAHDTGHRGRGRHVDADDVGAGVRRRDETRRGACREGRGRRHMACRRARARGPRSEVRSCRRHRTRVVRRLHPSRAARSHRGSSRSPCSGRGARRGGAPRLDASRSGPFFSISAFVRMTMPGVQNPHCRAPVDAKTLAYRSRSSVGIPSRVVIPRPAALASDVWQLTCALPSSRTVQHPHCPDGEHPSFGERTPSSSRSAASRWGWSSRHDTEIPLSTKETGSVPITPV